MWIFRIFLKFLLICPKIDFFTKLSDIAFVYLLCSIMLRHLKKILRSRSRLQKRLHNFCPYWSKLSILPQNRYFGKIDCYYCMPTVYLRAKTFLKNPQRANHKIKGCIILAQIGCKLLTQKDIFWKS